MVNYYMSGRRDKANTFSFRTGKGITYRIYSDKKMSLGQAFDHASWRHRAETAGLPPPVKKAVGYINQYKAGKGCWRTIKGKKVNMCGGKKG